MIVPDIGSRWRRKGDEWRKYDDLLTVVVMGYVGYWMRIRCEGAHATETDDVLPLATLLERYEDAGPGTGAVPQPKQLSLFDIQEEHLCDGLHP